MPEKNTPKATTKTEPLGTPIQVRFPKSVNDDLKQIAATNGIDLCDAIRMATRFGAPILRKRLEATEKVAA